MLNTMILNVIVPIIMLFAVIQGIFVLKTKNDVEKSNKELQNSINANSLETLLAFMQYTNANNSEGNKENIENLKNIKNIPYQLNNSSVENEKKKEKNDVLYIISGIIVGIVIMLIL